MDFETFRIAGRPDYPPMPVGVSVKRWGKRARYYSFGHVQGRNCGWNDARDAVAEAYGNRDGVLFHHSKFDMAVAEAHFGLAPPPPERVHDTLFLLFLDDCNQRELGLKPASARLLGWPAEEQDEVAEWLVSRQPVPGVRITASLSSQAKHPFGAYMAFCDGAIVGRYAGDGTRRGDTDRTEALFARLWPSVVDGRGMGEAYDRERRLTPVLMETERDGMRVDLPRLRRDVAACRAGMAAADAWIAKRLGVTDPDFKVSSGEQLTAAIFAAGLGDPDGWPMTESGKKHASDEEAFALVTDRQLGAMLVWRAKMKTVLTTFMENWLRVAERSGGFIYASWNQVRGERGGGARTGRLSSSPNFQNIPKEFKAIWRHEALPKALAALAAALALSRSPTRPMHMAAARGAVAAARARPACPVRGLPTIPMARCYVIPYEDGHVLIDRDYSQQEPRILAHFEGGELTRQYQADPWIDYHDNAKEHLERITARRYERRPVKDINLGLIYGEGVPALAKKTGLSVSETAAIKKAILTLYPGLKTMNQEMKRKAAAGEPLRTWGGRLCLCEPPSIVKGRFMTWEYKMVNTLIQGSAGDCTKEAMIRYHAAKAPGERFYMTVHDQFLASVPRASRDAGMERMRAAVESVEFAVQMLSEGSWSDADWASLVTFDKKGRVVAPPLPPANENRRRRAA